MVLIALKCPRCLRDIDLDDSQPFGFCIHCGTKVPTDGTVPTGDHELRIEIFSLIPTSTVEVRIDGEQDSRSFMMVGTARYRVSPGHHIVDIACGRLSQEFGIDITEDSVVNVSVGLRGILVGGRGLPQLL